MRRKNFLVIVCTLVIVLTSCNARPSGKAPFVYLNSTDNGMYEMIEYYPDEKMKSYVIKDIIGMFYENSYYDGAKYYVSVANAIFVYDSATKKVKELSGYVSNAIKKINGEIWFAFDKGFGEHGYSSALCKITESLAVDCLYEIKNQQVSDFYIDFAKQTFYTAGLGVGKTAKEMSEQYKVMKYDMQTGEEESVLNNGNHIMADRLTNICPGQFIVDGDIYLETGEKMGEIKDRQGKKLELQINDVAMSTTAFLGSDKMSLEVYGCKDNKPTHVRTIKLAHEPDIYPAQFSWDTADNGEITMPIDSGDGILEFIGFQSVNTRTGEVEVHLFDEPVYELHSIARFA